jgi:hypothetical protein
MPTSRSTDACGIIAPMRSLDFDPLDETKFEEFCFELLVDLGFVNVDWRKGTGFNASPSDRGRDIVGQAKRIDVDGTEHLETWFVDCKHYKRGVPPEALQGLLAWAHAERPHTALVIASNFLSNACKDYLRDYENNTRPPFRIKFWERPVLQHLTQDNRDLLSRFLLTGMRTESEIVAAEQEFFDQVWHERHLVFRHEYESGHRGRATEEIYQQALKAAEEVRARYPDVRPVESDFEWGMWNGKLSALRWVLGDEWDFLDT